jgi:peptidoglycan/xylan/chitin deacetylase (PgdA/CDA1 family)
MPHTNTVTWYPELTTELQSYGAKATFFITGNNLGKGHINDPATEYPAIVKV